MLQTVAAGIAFGWCRLQHLQGTHQDGGCSGAPEQHMAATDTQAARVKRSPAPQRCH